MPQMMALGVQSPNIDALGSFREGVAGAAGMDQAKKQAAEKSLQMIGAASMHALGGDINGQADPQRYDEGLNMLSDMGIDVEKFRGKPHLANAAARASVSTMQQLALAQDDRQFEFLMEKFQHDVMNDQRGYDLARDKFEFETQPASGGFQFGGNSVEAQALNGLINSGQLTPEEAQQLAAGKTVTDPETGAIIFLTPQGVFGRSAQGGEPQPIAADGGAGAAAPAAPSADVGAATRPGVLPITKGKPGKLATEGERRNRSLYSVVAPELQIVEENFDALADMWNQGASKLPMSDFATTPEYQMAANSLQTIVSSYLYSVSGATATPDEVKKQTAILTPKPGESEVSIASKKRRVRSMVDAIRQSGGQWSPEVGGGMESAPAAPAEAAPRLRFNPTTGELE
jgi:hypothetical protein